MRRRQVLRHAIALVSMMVCVCCLLIVTVTVLKLPEAPTNDGEMGFYPIIRSRKVSLQDVDLGKFGEMMVDMLPQDLAFTVFVPSDEAFKRDLRLMASDSLRSDKFNDTYAIVTRILGFSAVPRALPSANVRLGELVSYDSLSGFPLYVSKDIDGMLVVNRIRSEVVDVRKREIVVHVMDGVIMDADFEESVLADDDAEED
ncbi:palmitoyltransferase ZDHHC9/14/18 [Spatholobus suberectus]|nr:palmitoyltransferase ZDHHC9/14/18 [Spatholobus suberectus]